MFDARSTSLNRGIRIIQEDLKGEDAAISAWVNTCDIGGAEIPAEELVLYLRPTQTTLGIAKTLLGFWMNPSSTREQMVDMIRDRPDVVLG